MDIKDLEIWKKSRILRNKISKLVKDFPQEEKFRLIDQVVRSSRSLSANIAQGHGRFHFQENIQYCRQARGSLIETFDHLTVALDEGYLEASNFNKFDTEIEILMKMINGYINYLKRERMNQEELKLVDQ